MDVPSSGPPAAPEQAKGINSAALPGRRWVQGGRAETAFLPVVEGAEPLHLLPRSGICQRSWRPGGDLRGHPFEKQRQRPSQPPLGHRRHGHAQSTA